MEQKNKYNHDLLQQKQQCLKEVSLNQAITDLFSKNNHKKNSFNYNGINFISLTKIKNP